MLVKSKTKVVNYEEHLVEDSPSCLPLFTLKARNVTILCIIVVISALLIVGVKKKYIYP